MFDSRYTLNVTYIAPSKRTHPRTWPNNAPAMKNEILHLPQKLNVQLECNFIKYCACHEKRTILWTTIFSFSAILQLYYSFTLLFCNSTILLLFFDSTILQLNYSLTLLFVYSTILWLCDLVCISEVSQLNFLWSLPNLGFFVIKGVSWMMFYVFMQIGIGSMRFFHCLTLDLQAEVEKRAFRLGKTATDFWSFHEIWNYLNLTCFHTVN